MSCVDAAEKLAERLRDDARLVRRRGAPQQADAIDTIAEEVVEAFRAWNDEPLDLSRAADESGYKRESLVCLIRNGTVPNAGEEGRPRIRRCDLPRKPGHQPAPTDGSSGNDSVPSRTQMARSVVESERGDDDGER